MVQRWQVAALSSVTAATLLVHFAPRYSVLHSYVGTFLALFSAQLLALATWSVVLYPKLFSPLRHLPEPKGGSFFNGQFARILKEPSGIPMQEWINQVPNQGLIHYKTIFNTERIMLTSPQALGEVLVQKSYEFVKPLMMRQGLGRLLGGTGILLAEGEEHKTQRKLLMPAFAYRHIKDIYPIFWSKSREMVKAISASMQQEAASAELEKAVTHSSVVELNGWLSRTTLDIIGVAGMGYDFHAIQDPDTELCKTYRAVFEPSNQARMIGLVGLVVPMKLLRLIPMQRNNDMKAAAETIRGVCRRLIQHKQQKINRQEKTNDVDILSVAMESRAFTENQLIDQLMTFLVAGHETTSTSTTWSICLLCQHPEVQSRLREEVRTSLPSIEDDSTIVTAEILDRLPYLHAVVMETLRFQSPVPMTRREAAKDTSILGQFVPKGTDIIIAPYAVNFSTALWGEDALKFNPDRWMGPKKANNGGADSNYSLLTFLHGPRSCIGQQFAKAEQASLLAALVGKFEMELADKDAVIDIQSGVTARPKGGLHVRMTALDGW